MFPGEYHIIPNGIDLNRFGRIIGKVPTEMPPDCSPKVTILFVGRLDKRKGFLTLLESFIRLKPIYPQLQLQVIGPFEAKECQPFRQMVQACGVTGVEFVGYVSPDRLPSYYHQADIFCAPSIGFESFGIVLLEAMAAGLPVVASRIEGYRNLVSEGLEGLLVPPGQAEPLATALRRLVDQPYQRRKMGELGHIQASRYSWDHIVDKTLDVYLDTLRKKVKSKSWLFSETECRTNSNGQSTEAAKPC
jgi:phosphatidylinositol alpha-mannosyltransferase